MRTLIFITLSIFVGCATPAKSNSKLKKTIIEKNIKKNVTTKAQVIELLGHPEMINSSSDGEEQWVYVKGSSESDAGYGDIGAGMLGFMGTTLTGMHIGGANYSSSSSTKTTTFTVYFDNKNRVSKYNYSSARY